MSDATAGPEHHGRRAALVVLALAAVLAVAVCLRFYRLTDQGILGVDEGRYVLDALSARAELDAYLGLARGKYIESTGGPAFSLADYVARTDAALREQHPFAPKPGFACASALAMMLTGDVIAACSYVEAVCGVVMVALLFGLVRGLRNTRAALIAAALLAVSNYHVYFSRNAYPQCSAGALFLAAVWCHYRGSRASSTGGPRARAGWLVASGALLGSSFWFNYQIAGALPAFALVHALACANVRPPGNAVRVFVTGLFAIGCGAAGVLFLAEAWTYPMMALFRGYGRVYPHATFVELLAPRLLGQSGAPWNATGWPLFPYFLTVTDGAFYAAALALPAMAATLHVLYRAVRSPRTDARLLLHPAVVYGAVPLAAICAVFSFKTMQGARTFVTALPFLFAVTAVAVDYALRARTRLPRLALIPAAGCALVALFLYYPGRLHEVLSTRSAYPAVIDYVRSQQPPSACAAWSAVLEAYGAATGVTARSVYADAAAPAPPVFVSDWQELYNRRAPDRPVGLTPGAAPIAAFAHEFGRVFLTIEAFPSFGNTWDNIAWAERLDLEANRRVLVYDSRAMVGPR